MSTLTKIFIILQVVFALALSVLVVMFVSRQQSYKSQLLAEENSAITAHAAYALAETSLQHETDLVATTATAHAAEMAALRNELNDRIAKLESKQLQYDRLQSKFGSLLATHAVEVDSNKSLEAQLVLRDKELTHERPQLLRFTNENAQLNRRNAVLADERSQDEHIIRSLQETVARLNHRLRTAKTRTASAGGQSGLPTQYENSGTPQKINGTVRRVQNLNGRTYISTSLGSRDGVRKGTRMIVYKNNKYVGDLVITHVSKSESVGMVRILSPGQKVQKNDLVISGPGL